MNIVTAEYKYHEITNEKYSIECVLEDGIKLSIPINLGNRHYQAILTWIEDGGTVIDNPPE